MKNPLFFSVALLIGFCAILLPRSAFSQTFVPLADAAKHVGDSVTVTGKVFGARYLANAQKQPTLVNLGAAYPNQLLTIVIFGTERHLFPLKPEELFPGKDVTVSGKIELFKGKPQIVIHRAEQVDIREKK